MQFTPDAQRTRQLTTEELRGAFLVQGLFRAGEIQLRHVDLDRVVLGGAVPLDTALELDAPSWLAAAYFAERREIGVLNIGGGGAVTVDGIRYRMQPRDTLYIGKGSRDVAFASDESSMPARYYLVSYPAHASHPTEHTSAASAETTELGSADGANRRQLAKFIHPAGIRSAQLVMGVTEVMPGSVWNTMPPHTHHRRSEAYLYFDVPGDAMIVHLMGEPAETRHLVVRNEEVVLSPAWSIHSGCGTSNYAFCWTMGGENQDFTDTQPVEMSELK